MNLRPLISLLCTSLLLLSGQASAGAAPDPEVTAIIEQLGLREAQQPMSDQAGWKPRRVVVSAPPQLSGAVPDFEQRLQQVADAVELVIDRSGNYVLSAEMLADADAVIGFCTPTTVRNASARLLWLHNYYVGMDHCAGLSESQVSGRVFTNGKRLSGPTIAEHSLGMLLSLARGLPDYGRAQAQGEWDYTVSRKVRFGELAGKSLLVVGLGGIGTEVAWRAHGLGMTVSAIRNSSRSGPDYLEYVGLPDELHALAAKADVVVNALPLTAKTTGVFDAAFFDAVKAGSIFISVGRGKSTVTNDLVAALESGHLYAAGLDVTDPEPLPPSHPLWGMDNVIITPHTSAAGGGSARRGALVAVENLRRYVAGEPLLNIVNMQAGY